MNYLISIVGPTAVGKTHLSLFLARKYRTEILSCDSRQMYRYMDIGTAKPSPEVLEEIPHHFINILEPSEEYNAGRFEEEAEALLVDLFKKHQVVIAVGGSTLYFDALWNGMDDMPVIPPEIRNTLNSEFAANGLAPLVEELERADPETYARIDRKNQARVIRALEVYRTTGNPISFYRKKKTKERDYTLIKIGLTLEREILYKRIDERVEEMIREGLEKEVENLLSAGYGPEWNAMQSIGYREMVPIIRKKMPLQPAINLIQRNSRRYAKRQMTWYRRYEDIKWFEAGADEVVGEWLESEYSLIQTSIE